MRRGWLSRREAVRDLVGCAVAIVVPFGVAALFLLQVAAAVAAQQGHGVHGQWTATSLHHAAKGPGTTWYGVFVPDGDGPAQPDVALFHTVDGIDVGRSVPAIVAGTPEHVFAASNTTAWVAPCVWAAVFSGLAALVTWFVAHHVRPVA